MRRAFCLAIAMILCISLICPVFAAGDKFVSSISYKGAPTLVTSKDDQNNTVYGIVHDGSKTISGLGSNCLVITPVSQAKTSQLIPDEAEVLLLEVYDKLKSGEMKLPYDKLGGKVDAKKMVIRDLVDISWLCKPDATHPDHPAEVEPEKVYLEVTFKMGVSKNTKVYVMTYKNNEWNPIEKVVNNGNGTVTCTFEHLCPVVFCVESGSVYGPAKTGDASNIGLWIGVMVAAAVVLGAVVVISRRKK